MLSDLLERDRPPCVRFTEGMRVAVDEDFRELIGILDAFGCRRGSG